MPSSRENRADLSATLAARRDLGADYDDALAESFLDRIDRDIERRVEARVAERLVDARALSGPGGRPSVRQDVPLLALASLAFGVPLTWLAARVGDEAATNLTALVVVWLGIAAVNVASAVRRDRPGRERPSR